MSTMADAKLAPEDLAAWDELTRKPYAEQAKWFMNAFWASTFENDAAACENVFQRCLTCVELDEKKGAEGCELDEFMSHKFLETLGETLTVRALRTKLKAIDIDMNGRMALSEYLLFKYDMPVTNLVRPQADPKEVATASAMVKDAQTKVATAQRNAEELAVQLQRVQAAEAEQRAAVAELQRVEEEIKKKVADLEAKASTGGVVSRGRAKAELEQIKAEDPLPLRRAKITAEAAVRKLEKERKKAEAAKQEADASLAAAKQALNDAEAYLNDVKSRVGSSEGTFWWLQREVEEQRKYLPQSKGGVART